MDNESAPFPSNKGNIGNDAESDENDNNKMDKDFMELFNNLMTTDPANMVELVSQLDDETIDQMLNLSLEPSSLQSFHQPNALQYSKQNQGKMAVPDKEQSQTSLEDSALKSAQQEDQEQPHTDQNLTEQKDHQPDQQLKHQPSEQQDVRHSQEQEQDHDVQKQEIAVSEAHIELDQSTSTQTLEPESQEEHEQELQPAAPSPVHNEHDEYLEDKALATLYLGKFGVYPQDLLRTLQRKRKLADLHALAIPGYIPTIRQFIKLADWLEMAHTVLMRTGGNERLFYRFVRRKLGDPEEILKRAGQEIRRDGAGFLLPDLNGREKKGEAVTGDNTSRQ